MPVPDRKASLFVVAFLFSILVAPFFQRSLLKSGRYSQRPSQTVSG